VKKYLSVLIAVIFLMVAVGVLVAADEKKAQDTYTLKAPNGAVKFDHKKHAAAKCETCHHASKPEKPSKAAHEACADCHTTPATAPMKTKLQAAFHNPAAQSGVCIDCHKKEVAAGKKAPTKCAECHVKANG